MVTPVNTIDHSEGYVAFSSSVDQTVQYDEACLLLYQMHAAIGTIEQTCNGSAVNSSGSNISTTAHMVHGSAGSQAHTWWIVLIGDMRTLVELDNANSDTTPQQIRFYRASAPYNTDGSTTTKPTISIAGREFTSFTINIIPNATAVACGAFWWRSSSGCWVLGVKNSGDAFYRVGLLGIQGGTDGDGETDFASGIFRVSGAGDALGSASLESSTNWQNSMAIAAGTVATAGGILHSPVWSMGANWTAGLVNSRAKFREIALANNQTGSSGRYFGVIDDIRGCPQNLAFNAEDPLETGTHRLRTIGDIAVPLRAGTADV